VSGTQFWRNRVNSSVIVVCVGCVQSDVVASAVNSKRRRQSAGALQTSEHGLLNNSYQLRSPWSDPPCIIPVKDDIVVEN